MKKILKEKEVYKGKLIVKEATIENESSTYTRQQLYRQDASVVLILNTDSNKIILTKQFRYPVYEKTKENMYEAVAGKVDPGESPLDAAIRETEEEVGYRIKPGNITLLTSCFSSPGYSSEEFYMYYATVTDKDRVSAGGGLKSENEEIEVVEMELSEFREHIRERKLRDAKTYVAGLLVFGSGTERK